MSYCESNSSNLIHYILSGGSTRNNSVDMDDEIDDFIIIQILKKNKGVYIIFFFCRTSLLSGKMYTLEILASHDD